MTDDELRSDRGRRDARVLSALNLERAVPGRGGGTGDLKAGERA